MTDTGRGLSAIRWLDTSTQPGPWVADMQATKATPRGPVLVYRTRVPAGWGVLDLDNKPGKAQGIATLRSMGLLRPPGPTYLSSSHRGLHIPFRTDRPIPTATNPFHPGMDRLGPGHKVFVQHEHTFDLLNTPGAVPMAPAWFYGERTAWPTRTGTETKGAKMFAETGELGQGERHYYLLDVAKKARRREDLDYRALLARLTEANEARCRPPKSTHDLERLAAWAVESVAVDDVLHQLWKDVQRCRKAA